MSLSTQAFIPTTAKKSGNAGEGKALEKGGESAAETAARFQTLLKDMKKGEPGRTNGQTGSPEVPEGETAEASQEGAGARAPENTLPGNKRAAGAAFATSNLADALKQVSQTVLAHKDPSKAQPGPIEGDGVLPELAQNPDMPADLATSSSALAVNAVLAARADSGHQGAVPAQQVGTAVPHQVHSGKPEVSGAFAGEGERPKTGTSSLFAQFGVEPEKVADPMSDRASSRSQLLDEAAGTMKVLRQETHFAPNMRLSPAQQVGDRLTTVLKDVSAGTTQVSGGMTAKAEGPVLKTLDIQLTPHELGTVKVSLKMVGDTVEVTLVTSKAQTAELLKQDRQVLDQMLRATGFKADSVTVQAADDRVAVQQPGQASAGGSASGQNGAGQNAAGQNAAGDGQAQNFNGNGSGQQNGRAGQDGRADVFRNPETSKGKSHEEGTGVSLSDGIYL